MCAMSATRTASDLGGDLGEGREVDRPRQRGAAAEDDLGPLAQRQVAHLVEVDPAGVPAHPVLHRVEPLAADRHARPVRQVAAHRQRQPHDGVAGRGERQVDGQVGGRPRVRLHVRVVHPEQRLRPRHRDRLDRVDELLALVVPLARVTLGVLVGQHRARGLEHGDRHVVLRRDQPELVLLAACLVVDQPRDLRVFSVDVRDGRLVHGDRPPRRGQGYQPGEARSRERRGGTRDRSIPSVCSPALDGQDPAMSTTIILDCDPGIDDALAIAFAAGSPGDRAGRPHHRGRQRRAGQDHGERAGGGVVRRRSARCRSPPGAPPRCCARRCTPGTCTARRGLGGAVLPDAARRPPRRGTRSTSSSRPRPPRPARSRWSRPAR